MTPHEKIRDIINDSMFYIAENLDNEDPRWDDSTRAMPIPPDIPKALKARGIGFLRLPTARFVETYLPDIPDHGDFHVCLSRTPGDFHVCLSRTPWLDNWAVVPREIAMKILALGYLP